MSQKIASAYLWAYNIAHGLALCREPQKDIGDFFMLARTRSGKWVPTPVVLTAALRLATSQTTIKPKRLFQNFSQIEEFLEMLSALGSDS